jgi:hypothetical protein
LKLRIPVSTVIFLGSYLPLAFILLVQDFNYTLLTHDVCWRFWRNNTTCVIPLTHPKSSAFILGICLISFCITLVTLSVSQPNLPITITEAEYIPAELMSYTLPYVVAFMGIGYQAVLAAKLLIFNGGQRRDRTADASLFRAA